MARVILTAFGFAALEAGAGAMQRDAGVPSTLASGDSKPCSFSAAISGAPVAWPASAIGHSRSAAESATDGADGIPSRPPFG